MDLAGRQHAAGDDKDRMTAVIQAQRRLMKRPTGSGVCIPRIRSSCTCNNGRVVPAPGACPVPVYYHDRGMVRAAFVSARTTRTQGNHGVGDHGFGVTLHGAPAVGALVDTSIGGVG